MLEQLRRVRRRYDEVNLSLQDPVILADGGRYAALMKEYKRLTPLMEALDEYERVCAECAERRNHSRKAVLNTQKSAEAIVPWGNSREGRNQYTPE